MKLKITRQVDVSNKGIPTTTQMKKWVTAVLGKLPQTKDRASVELSIRIVSLKESSELNQTYRHKKGPTNILSFPDVAIPGLASNYLGDLAICADLVEQEAKKAQIKDQDHWAHLIVHGCLHLLGYDHVKEAEAEIMEGLEIEILRELNIENPY